MTQQTNTTQEDRDAAARDFLDDPDAESASWDDAIYGLATDWLILTDEEADERAMESIRESAWAFVPSFLENYLPEGVSVDVIESLQERCEDANPAVLAMLGERFEEFASDAISSDGRGHFLSSWDGSEIEFEHNGRTWYAYRN